MMSGGRLECRIYIGNLPPYARTKDLDDIFFKYGKINFIDIKNNNNRGSPYGFVEFDDPRDAEDAVKGRDGYHFDGYKLRVEFCKGGKGNRNDRDDYRSRRRRSGPSSRRSDYRVTVTGLPASGSWQDLKDHMREAGEVYYADVYKNGSGVVEFSRYEDMKYALRKLDDSKFRSHEGETSYIRVRPDPRNGRSVSRSRSGSIKSRGTPNYSPANSRSRS